MADEAQEKKIAELSFGSSKAETTLNKINEGLRNATELAEKANKAFIEMGKNTANISFGGLDSKTLTKEVNDVSKRLEKLQDNKIKQEQKAASQISVINARNQANMERDAAKHEQKLELLHEKQANSAKSMYSKIQDYANKVILTKGILELKKAISETIDEMVQVESSMIQIDRVLNEDSLNIDNYRDKLIQLAYDYGNAFDNVADVTLRLAQAGFDSQESLALTEKTLLALNTAELNATEATDDMVAIMAQWGLMTGDANEEAEQYASIIDKINKVADNFPTTSADILDALKKMSSGFNLAGASIDETIALFVAAETASQRGGKQIGNALANIVQQLKDSSKLKIADSLGLDFYTDETKTEFKNIIDIFTEMSERMAALKNAGKESSVEMQNLLSIFTVFRRNIGASLLGEMSGEDNTYMEALETSMNSLGYSLQENEKYMRSAAAAQQQLNAELLKLKTSVWDNGLEEVYRNMLAFGTDIIDKIRGLIDTFGLVPTSIGAITAAYTILSNKVKVQDIITMIKKVKDINSAIKETGTTLSSDNKLLEGTSKSFKKYVTNLDTGKASLLGYGKQLVTNTIKTAALTAATIALNVAISAGISLIVTGLVSAIDKAIHAEENARKALEDDITARQDNIDKIQSEKESLEDLAKQYEELAKKDNRTDEDNIKIYELQTKINEAIKDSGKQVELVSQQIDEQGKNVLKVNDNYKEQLNIIKSIQAEKQKQIVEDKKQIAEDKTQLFEGGIDIDESFWKNTPLQSAVNKELPQLYDEIRKVGTGIEDESKNIYTFTTAFNKLTGEQQYGYLVQIRKQLVDATNAGKDYSEAIDEIDGYLTQLNKLQSDAISAINDYKDALGELYTSSGVIDEFNEFLDSISGTYEIEGPQQLIEQIEDINEAFTNGEINIEEYFDKIQEKIDSIDFSTTGEELEAYQAIFAATTSSLAEGIEQLQAGLDSGTIDFTEYSLGIKEAADNTLDLYVKSNELQQGSDGMWLDASGNVDAYATNLQRANDYLASLGGVLTTIGDNYDYIAEHANASGEAMFNASQVGTEAYQNLASEMTNSLNQLSKDNEIAFNHIVEDISKDTGLMTNEIVDSNGYINEGLFNNSDALNSALNSSASQTQSAVQRVTTSMGNVITALGKVISNFEYELKATPFISGGFGFKTNEFGFPTGIQLPSFGFTFSGSGGQGSSISELSSALQDFGASVSSLNLSSFKFTPKKMSPYTSNNIPSSSSSSSPSSSSTPKSSGGSSSKGSSGSSSSSSTSNAEKEAEELYKNNLARFTDYVDERERLEQRWVNKQKELGQLSNKDFLYIIQQRIGRYQAYLDELSKMTWINAEDRAKLEKQYTEEIEDLQLDYLKYLENILDEQTKAIEEARDERIKAIEDEADAQIDALKKVEDENDRIRDKEDYENQRRSIQEEINYWSQRTGREAQENLLEAQKELKELDEDWNRTLEDWNLDDQIQAIEDARDKEIQAVEDSAQREIDELKRVYDYKVQLFSETGKIIYENGVIESNNLYNAYKSNFVDKIKADLESIRKQTSNTTTPKASTSTSTPVQQTQPKQEYETYTIKWGDTLTSIARRFGTTIEKILQANPYVTDRNKIYSGRTLKIPKFHEGGETTGFNEGYALLKPHEIILKPEWASGIKKLAKLVEKGDFSGTSQTINIEGDLVKMNANIANKSDADYVVKKAVREIKSKLNIKK